jgi:YD repeat-containing protein
VSGAPLGGPGFPPSVTSGTQETVDGFTNLRWRTKADANGNVTLFDGYDAKGNPLRVVEGWIDDGSTTGELDAGDDYARRRDTTWHPRLRQPLEVEETSALTGVLGDRVTISDYDDPATGNPALPNEAPTDRLAARIVTGKTLAENGATATLTLTTTYGYDAAGRITSVSGPAPRTTPSTATFDGPGSGYLETTYSDFDPRGNPQTVTDPNGRATAFTYDAAGRVKTVTPLGPGTTTITFTYDVDGNLTRVDFPDDSFGNDSYLRLGYDAKSRITFLADAQGNAIVYEYAGGRATREALYTGFTDLASRGELKGDANFGYDQAGRLIEAFNPLFPNPDYGSPVSTTFGHDAKGNPTSITDENGRQDTLVYDALDRLTEVQQLRTATYTTAFQYDPLGDVTKVTDAAGKDTDYRYDDGGRLVEVASPDTGTTRYVYDEAGNLVTKIENATGGSPRTTRYEYDGLDRLTRVDLPNDPDWVFTYDTSATLNQKGRLASVTNGIVTTELTYTDRGQVATEATTLGGKRYEVAYEHDAAGNRTKVRTPSGVEAVTRYAGTRPKELAVTADGTTHTVRDIAFLPFGPRTQAKLPPFDSASGQNVVTSTRTYDLRYQATELDVTGPTGVFVDRSYTWNHTAGAPGPADPGPNLDRVIDHRDASESRFYFHDELDRLEKATDLSGNAFFTYGYDAAGNRTSETTSAGTTTYSYTSNTVV